MFNSPACLIGATYTRSQYELHTQPPLRRRESSRQNQTQTVVEDTLQPLPPWSGTAGRVHKDEPGTGTPQGTRLPGLDDLQHAHLLLHGLFLLHGEDQQDMVGQHDVLQPGAVRGHHDGPEQGG